ncbi:MAG: DUF373 family protein [Methanolobus sp.]
MAQKMKPSLPIVQSRIKIDSVRRIVVMQSANLESTYYIIKHAFNDPKISQTFFAASWDWQHLFMLSSCW